MIVLDTHVLIWWVNGDKRLSKPALKAINNELNTDDGSILISSISTWEIALLVEKGRLSLTMDTDDWIRTVSSIDKVKFVAVDNETFIQSVRLPDDFHPDPADRIITALARQYGVALISSDRKIINYKHVKTIWQ